MALDEVISKDFSYSGGLEWRKRSGRTFNARQDDNGDFILVSRLGTKDGALHDYSGQGYYLFASLSRYLADSSNLPDFKEITLVEGCEYPHEWGSNPEKDHLMEQVEKQIPKERSLDLQIGSGLGGAVYYAYLNGDNFVIAAQRDTDERTFRELMPLDVNDAVLVLKAIYYYSGHKEVLRNVYEATRP